MRSVTVQSRKPVSSLILVMRTDSARAACIWLMMVCLMWLDQWKFDIDRLWWQMFSEM